MVVRPIPGGLLCIRQPDHAALSGVLAKAWGGGAPELLPRPSVELAARRHDAGWLEPDEAPSLDSATGRPHDYRTAPLAERLEVAERSVARVAEEDPYAGWLVSRHFASFHAGSDDPAASAWMTGQVGRRAELLARARPRVGREALHPHVLEANFDWLQLFDALSLAVCHDWESWEGRPMSREYGERETTWRYAAGHARGDPRWVEGRVTPWPFGPRRIETRIPARRLMGERWESDRALREAWRGAEAVRLEAVLVPG